MAEPARPRLRRAAISLAAVLFVATTTATVSANGAEPATAWTIETDADASWLPTPLTAESVVQSVAFAEPDDAVPDAGDADAIDDGLERVFDEDDSPPAIPEGLPEFDPLTVDVPAPVAEGNVGRERVDQRPLPGWFKRSTAAVFRPLPKWAHQFEVGGRFLDGNSDEDFVNVLGKFENNEPKLRFSMDLGGNWGQARGNRTNNRWFLNGTVDRAVYDDWIAFCASKNEYDEFENLDYRGTLAVGPGYRFYNDALRRMIVRIGPAFTQEFYDEPQQTRSTADWFSELEFFWPLFERLKFEFKGTSLWSVSDPDILRLVSTTGISLRLDEDQLWNLKLAMRHEYNSVPNPGRLPSDFNTSLLLVYKRR